MECRHKERGDTQDKKEFSVKQQYEGRCKQGWSQVKGCTKLRVCATVAIVISLVDGNLVLWDAGQV